jgi:hypothetical protein
MEFLWLDKGNLKVAEMLMSPLQGLNIELVS